MELKLELDGKEIVNGIITNPRPTIKERLEKQLELLAKASSDCAELHRIDSLCLLTEAMVLVANRLD